MFAGSENHLRCNRYVLFDDHISQVQVNEKVLVFTLELCYYLFRNSHIVSRLSLINSI